MTVLANPQEIKSWFIGILEGEGSAHGNKGNSRIEIVNTDMDIINECIDFLKSNYIFHILYRTERKNPKHKTKYRLCVNPNNECYILIKTLGEAFQCRYHEFMTKLGLSSSTITRDTTLTPDLYWLIGIIEAEGSFNMGLNVHGRYKPSISIKNTNKAIMEKIAKTLKSMDCSWYIYSYKGENPTRKDTYQVRIDGIFRSRRFLYKVKDLFKSDYYLNRAELLLEFIESRMIKARGEPYSEREHDIYRWLKLKI